MPAPPHRAGKGPPRRDLGLSLVEVMVSLSIVSAIGVAGLALLTSLADVQARLDQRFLALAALETFLSDTSADFAQADPRTLTLDAGALAVRTEGCDGAGVTTFAISDAALTRTVTTCPGLSSQLGGLVDARMLVIASDQTEWTRWPPPAATDISARAVRISLTFAASPSTVQGTVWILADLPHGAAP